MKYLFIILAVIMSVSACQTADKKATGKTLTLEEKEKATKDSANFTTIQWLDSSYIDLGKVKEGRVVEVAFRFKNTGIKNLIIADVRPGCGCTTPEKPEQPFAPGEEGVIKAKFDSKGQHLGEHRKYVNVTANTSPSPTTELIFRVDIID